MIDDPHRVLPAETDAGVGECDRWCVPRRVQHGVGEAGEFGHPAAHVVAVRVELRALERRRIRGLTLPSGVGLPGRVLETGAPLWIADVTKDGNFPRAAAARTAGLRSAIGLPVAVSGRVEGVVEFFSREVRESDQKTLKALTGLASQVGAFIERARAVQAVRRSADQLRSVMDHMLDGLAIADRSLRIVQCNRAFARIFDYEIEELPGLPAARLLPDKPEYQDPVRLGDMLRESLGRVTEREGRRRDGEIFPLQAQVYEVETEEGPLVVAHIRDLSQAREVDRLKKRFIASISHELRTPITAIRGSLGLLAQSVGGVLPPEARELVNLAERNAVRLSSLISDILDFERIDSGLLSLKREVFSIDEAIENTLDVVGGQAADAGIRMVTATSGLSAYGDQGRIEQVLVNLMSNAIKFSPASALRSAGRLCGSTGARSAWRAVPAAGRSSGSRFLRQPERGPRSREALT